jgi:hypothetical protein
VVDHTPSKHCSGAQTFSNAEKVFLGGSFSKKNSSVLFLSRQRFRKIKIFANSYTRFIFCSAQEIIKQGRQHTDNRLRR